MVRSGSSALGTVVETKIVPATAREVKHVLETMPDRLRGVLGTGNNQMTRENGEWIEGNAVLPSFTTFEFDMVLLSGTVLRT